MFLGKHGRNDFSYSFLFMLSWVLLLLQLTPPGPLHFGEQEHPADKRPKDSKDNVKKQKALQPRWHFP